MAGEKLGYAEFLADLESKRAALDTLIGSFRAALSLGALGHPGDVDITAYLPNGTATSTAVDLPTGAFLGKSLPAAIKIYLAAVKRKQTTREIVAALREGGIESTSPNFENVVTGALHRLKASGDVLRFRDGWGLAEFYPESLRSRITQETKPQAKKKPSTKPAKAVKPRKGARGRKAQRGPSTDERILAILASGPNSSATLTERLGMAPNVIGLAVGRLKKHGKVEKMDNGNFAITTAELPFPKAV